MRILDEVEDGAPCSDPVRQDRLPGFLLKEIRRAPSDELGVLLDLLRRPPAESELWNSGLDRVAFEDAFKLYFSGYLFGRPTELRDPIHRLTDEGDAGGIVLGSLALVFQFPKGSTGPYLPTLKRLAPPPWTEDRAIDLACAFGAARSEEAATFLAELRSRFPDEDASWIVEAQESIRKSLR